MICDHHRHTTRQTIALVICEDQPPSLFAQPEHRVLFSEQSKFGTKKKQNIVNVSYSFLCAGDFVLRSVRGSFHCWYNGFMACIGENIFGEDLLVALVCRGPSVLWFAENLCLFWFAYSLVLVCRRASICFSLQRTWYFFWFAEDLVFVLVCRGPCICSGLQRT